MSFAYGLATLSQLIGLAFTVAIIGMGLWATIHCLRTRADAFPAASKWQKKYWLIALIVCTLLPLAPFQVMGLLISAIGSLIYLLDAKPKLDEVLRPKY